MANLKNESMGAVTRNNDRFKESFMIDCGTPENALALADAISEEAYGHPAGSAKDDAGRHFLGGEIILYWPVGRFFTASVNPCEKAIEWCQGFLKNLGGSAPGITGNGAGLEGKSNIVKETAKMKTPKNESSLSGLLARNPVWNEIGGGDAADLADSIEKGEWIGLMTGAEDDTDAGWDKYIADTFGPFADFVEARYIKPDEGDPDFKVAQIKFKPMFNRLPTNAKTGLLADLGDALKDGYFAEGKRTIVNFLNSGLSEEKTSEAELPAKLKNRAKVKQFSDLFNKYHGFEEWGPGFLDLYNDGKFGEHIAVPGDAAMTKEKAQALADKRYGDFDDFVEWTLELIPEGGPKGEDMWFPCIAFKPSIMDLSLEDAKFVFSELSDAMDKAMGF